MAEFAKDSQCCGRRCARGPGLSGPMRWRLCSLSMRWAPAVMLRPRRTAAHRSLSASICRYLFVESSKLICLDYNAKQVPWPALRVARTLSESQKKLLCCLLDDSQGLDCTCRDDGDRISMGMQGGINGEETLFFETLEAGIQHISHWHLQA